MGFGFGFGVTATVQAWGYQGGTTTSKCHLPLLPDGGLPVGHDAQPLLRVLAALDEVTGRDGLLQVQVQPQPHVLAPREQRALEHRAGRRPGYPLAVCVVIQDGLQDGAHRGGPLLLEGLPLHRRGAQEEAVLAGHPRHRFLRRVRVATEVLNALVDIRGDNAPHFCGVT